MAYPHFDKTSPTHSQTLAAFATSFRENLAAIKDMIVWGGEVKSGNTVVQTGGTPGEPTEITSTLAAGERIFTSGFGWTDGQITQVILSYSPTSSGSPIDIATTGSFGYSAGEIFSATNIGIGPLAKLLPLLGKVKDLLSRYNTHESTTAGAGIHGTGSLSLQGSNSVTITGGVVKATTLGSTTSHAPGVNGKYSRENVYFYGTVGGGNTLPIDIANGGWLEFGVSGSSVSNPAYVSTTSYDLSPSYNRFQIATVLVYVAPGVGTQYLNWTGYYNIGLGMPELVEGAHIFHLIQRSNGAGQVLKVVQYGGLMI